MRSLPKLLCAILSLMLLVSCSSEQPIGPAGSQTSDAAKSANQTVINDFVVQYDGRTFDGDETTFSYTVFGTGDFIQATQFRLELPECAGELNSWLPSSHMRFYTDPGTGIDFIKWRVRINGDDLVGDQFSLTYPGDVPEGMILSGVKVGALFEYAEVPGPCAGAVVYAIGGTVFTDLDGDGALDFEELGIANVAVELEAADGSITSQTTDAMGRYEFTGPAGAYTLRIDYEGYPEAFNAELQNSFDATTPPEIEVSVGPDSSGNGFGFSPQTEVIIEELENGDLVSDGEDRIFWKRHVRWAIRNDTHADQVHSPEEIVAFLAAVQELYLTEIFQFTPGEELEEAYEILRATDLTPIDELRQQLLVTELNEVSGRGLVDNPELQDVLIAWGEAVWVDNQSVALATPELIPPAIDLFTLINTGGGGGVDE